MRFQAGAIWSTLRGGNEPAVRFLPRLLINLQVRSLVESGTRVRNSAHLEIGWETKKHSTRRSNPHPPLLFYSVSLPRLWLASLRKAAQGHETAHLDVMELR